MKVTPREPKTATAVPPLDSPHHGFVAALGRLNVREGTFWINVGPTTYPPLELFAGLVSDYFDAIVHERESSSIKALGACPRPTWILAMIGHKVLLPWSLFVLVVVGLQAESSGDTAAQDHAVVQSLLRIPNATLATYPWQKEAVLRHLDRIHEQAPADYVKISRQLNVRDQPQQLVQILARSDERQARIDAAGLLMRFGNQKMLQSAVDDADDRRAAAAATLIGFVSTEETAQILKAVMQDESRHLSVRSAAASGLGHSWFGEQILLQLARQDQVPSDVRFEVSNALLGSWSKETAEAAKKLSSLVPEMAAQSTPLPPINKLLQMRGDGKQGKQVFDTIGTCAKCHRVLGEGKEVGPDLSEIGSKLSREDIYVNILNPSAAVSHNYETYALLTVDGKLITGILVNQTDEAVTIKTGEAVLITVASDEIEELKKQSVSLMPADLHKHMTVQNLLDLVDYLVLLKKKEESPFHVLASNAAGAAISNSRSSSDAVAALDVAPGLRVQLFASEPQMQSPTSIDVDHLGRVWVCEAVNYRHFRNPYNEPRKAGDRILVLEDSDGDGVADQSTVFYQGTDIDSPHGVCVLGDRVIVSAGDRVILFRDTDGDLKPDEKKLMFTGISGVQHDHGIHSFMPGPDGKLYFNFGNEGKQLYTADGEPVVDRAGNLVNATRKPYQQGMVFRCDVDGSNVETLAWNFRNNWEVCIDSFGTMWQSDNDDDGNRGVRINFVMEFGNYGYRDERSGATWQTTRIGMDDELGQRQWHQNDPGVIPNLLSTGAGSPTGIAVYEGDLLPDVFRNQVIHCDPGPNVVRGYPVESDKAGYTATTVNLAKGVRDQWFRPVDICTAPDGSLIIADWYDPGVGGHRMGDATRGRLFRMTVDGHEAYDINTPNFATLEAAGDALNSPNQSMRFLAGEAVQRFWMADRPQIDQYLDPAKIVAPRLRARWLWQLARVPGQVGKEAIAKGLTDPDSDVRIAAVRAARQNPAVSNLEVVKKIIDDPSPQVRRELAIALRGEKSPSAASLWTQLALVHDGQDRWYLEALGIGAEGQWDEFFSAWEKQVGEQWNQPKHHDIIWRARTPAACAYLGQMIQEAKTAKEQERYFRALDFHDAAAKQTALEAIVAK